MSVVLLRLIYSDLILLKYIRLFSDVMKRLGIKLDGDELYEGFQTIYDESVDRDW